MSYSAGKHQFYIDLITAKEDYTTAVYDSMTTPAVNWLCDLYGMVVFNDLTVVTDKGHRYFIGFDGADNPSYAIGWAAGNTNNDNRYLLIVLMFDGVPLSSVLDATGTGNLNNSTYHKILLIRYFPDHGADYNFVNYVKSTYYKGISNGFWSSNNTVTSGDGIDFAIFQTDNNKKINCYKDRQYKTYEWNTDGSIRTVSEDISFRSLKNILANSDFEYIAQKRLDHDAKVLGMYIYSVPNLSVNSIYKVNGEYYMCFASSGEGSYMMKLADYVS